MVSSSLQCRILVTSRNADIFQAAKGKVVPFPMSPSGFTLAELSSFVSSACFSSGVLQFKEDFCKQLYFHTKGLPAIVNIITVLSRNDPDRLEAVDIE